MKLYFARINKKGALETGSFNAVQTNDGGYDIPEGFYLHHIDRIPAASETVDKNCVVGKNELAALNGLCDYFDNQIFAYKALIRENKVMWTQVRMKALDTEKALAKKAAGKPKNKTVAKKASV